jgi:hypothetical protein
MHIHLLLYKYEVDNGINSIRISSKNGGGGGGGGGGREREMGETILSTSFFDSWCKYEAENQ